VNQAIHKGFRLSFVMFAASLAALIVCFISITLIGVWRVSEQTPRLAVDSLVKALQTHQRQTGRFPTDFRELEARVWKHKQAPDYGPDGRSFTFANYFYLYHPVDPSSVTIWIIPIGPRREEGSTHFVLLKPDSLRRWKGAPLSPDEIKNLPPVPQYSLMALLGMTEQNPISLTKRR
jgi:hypothetical protein